MFLQIVRFFIFSRRDWMVYGDFTLHYIFERQVSLQVLAELLKILKFSSLSVNLWFRL